MKTFALLRSTLPLAAFSSLAALAFSASSLMYAQSVTYAGTTPSLNFGSVNVCSPGATAPAPCNKTFTLTYNVAAGTTIGSIGILTTGTANLDFRAKAGDTSTTLCAAKTYGSATTCTVDVAFVPLAPGLRLGAVQIADDAGNVLASTHIYGTGAGPVIAYGPTSFNYISSPFNMDRYTPVPQSLVFDASGNLFVVDVENGEVLEVPVASGYTTSKILFDGSPSGVAVDGAGNVFFSAEGTDKAVWEIPASSGSAKIVASGFNSPNDLALDPNGNIFVVDDGASAVYEILAEGGYTTINTLGSGFNNPSAIAVDVSGNVFVADSRNDAIKEILAAGGYTTVNTLGSGFSFPEGITLDPAGNVYVADPGNSAAKEILAAGGYKTVKTLYTGLYSGKGIALDASGDLFIGGFGFLLEYPRAVPPIINPFAATAIGATGTPQSVQLLNVGNAPLSFSGLNASENFAVVPGSGTPVDCSTTTALASGSQCNLSINFVPKEEGPLTGAATVTDNALNGEPAKQVFQLSGYGGLYPIADLSPNYLQFGTIPLSSTASQSLTITNTGGNPLTISSPSLNSLNYKITASTCGAAVPSGQSCTLQIEFAPLTVGSESGDVLTLQTNAAQPVSTVELVGNANGVGTEMAGPLDFFYAYLGSPAVLPLTITNIGIGGTVTVGTRLTGPSYKVLTTAQNTCVAGITAGQSCTLPIEFNGVAIGWHNDALLLTPSAGPQSTVALRGFTGGVGALVTSMQFGSIATGTLKVLPLTIYNYNVGKSVLVGAKINGPSYTVLESGNTCLAALSYGQSCTLPIQFIPTAVGVHDDVLTIKPSGGAASSIVTLHGKAD